jgi:hypothetical protein
MARARVAFVGETPYRWPLHAQRMGDPQDKYGEVRNIEWLGDNVV